MRHHYLLTMLTACAVLAAFAGNASAQGNATATATFSRTDVRIVEASSTTLQVRIAPPENEQFPPLGSGGEVVLEVTPSAAVTTAACDADQNRRFALRISSETEALTRDSDTGAITIARDVRDYNGQPAELRLTACENRSDYRDATVTLAFAAASLMTQQGNVVAGPPARVQVINDDPVPVVDFATGALEIDEGMSRTVAVVAEGELGGAVMRVAVEAAGDARISLQQGDQPLDENADGSLAVKLGAGGTAVLTVVADGDESLASGETKTATVRIVDTNGAKVGDIDTLTVTVNGVTDVPALPLAGLLLQALLLAAAGARLYRRRRG